MAEKKEPEAAAKEPEAEKKFTVVAIQVGARASGLVKPGTKMQVTESQFSETWMQRV